MPALPEVDLLVGALGEEPALDVALAAALLAQVAAGRRGPVLRCHRPAATVAFGRRDALLPGFAAAAGAARRHGFTPVVRAAGGRAAAYDDGCLVFEEVMPATGAMAAGIDERFRADAARLARSLRSLGVDARVGQVPGEYCPGPYSVNARGKVKLMGAAQRVISGGWLLATVVVVTSAVRVREVLEAVYGALGLEWDPHTSGGIADEAPGVTVEDVQRAVLAVYAERYALRTAEIGAEALAAARERLAGHRVTGS